MELHRLLSGLAIGEGVASPVSQRAGFLHHTLLLDGPGENVLFILGREKQILHLQKILEKRQKNIMAGFHMTKIFS